MTGLDRGNDGYGLMGGMIGILAAWIGFNGVGVWAGLLRPLTEPLAVEQA
jgi:spore maturation protein SpmA